MKLIASPNHPFSRKVRIVLLEKKIECETQFLEASARNETNIDWIEQNPLGYVPVLILDDGLALYDSRVIVEHLDHISPVNRLLPQDKRSQIQVKRLETLADGLTNATEMLTESTLLPDMRKAHLQKIARGLTALEEELKDKTWFRDTFSLADIAVFCLLDRLDPLMPTWQSEYPKLAAYYGALGQRPSFLETQ